MKKRLMYFVVFIVLLMISYGFYYTHPQPISRSIKGIEYQLGAGHDRMKSVTIHITGKLHRPLFGNKTFIGKIDLKGASNLNPDHEKQLKIKFQSSGAGVMVYSYFKKGLPVTQSYGTLYANKDFSEVTITEFRKDENRRGWLSGNGWMITGPADRKKKALEISNILMKKAYQLAEKRKDG